MEFDLEQTDALLSTTRAVRKRLDFDREVPDDVLLECLQLAVQAPTGSNRQSWRWMVVRDAAKKEALAEMYRAAGGDYLAAAAKEADDGSQTSRVLDSANFLAQNLGRVPVLLIPLIIGRLPDNSTANAAGLFGSIMPAVWSFQLALRSRGLGSCLHHTAPRQGAGGGRTARHPRPHDAGRPAAGRVHPGHRLQAGGSPAGRGDHLPRHLQAPDPLTGNGLRATTGAGRRTDRLAIVAA